MVEDLIKSIILVVGSKETREGKKEKEIMPNLTVELVKIVNLRDANPGVDVADPYVKLDLMQNNIGKVVKYDLIVA